MLKSMTGYGKAQLDHESFFVEIEMRTLNSKFLDASMRLPKELNEKELEIRAMLQEHLERGRVSISVEFQRKQEIIQLPLNEDTVEMYYRALQRMANRLMASNHDIFRLAIKMAEDYQGSPKADTLSDLEWQSIHETFQKVLQQCNQFRIEEGKVLKTKFKEYVQKIRDLLEKVDEQDPKRLTHVREKLHNRVSEWKNDENFDANRFEQELIYYIEKLDINEEKVRLRKHLDYTDQMLDSEESNGKKLNFIAQEIGREINTIGSKANDAMIQHFVVAMKEELEKIKEQSLNIL